MPSSVPVAPGSGAFAYGNSNSSASASLTSTTQTLMMPSSVPVAPGSGGYAYGYSNSSSTFAGAPVPAASDGGSGVSSTSSPVVPFTGGAESVTSMRGAGFVVAVGGLVVVLGCL